MIFPVYWMISTAFKRDEDVYSLTPTWLPIHPTLQHFSDAIHRPFFWTDVRNSMIVDSLTVAISLVLAFVAAVALAKYRFSKRWLFILLIIGIQMVTGAGMIIPLYVVVARRHQLCLLS